MAHIKEAVINEYLSIINVMNFKCIQILFVVLQKYVDIFMSEISRDLGWHQI